ncbi:MAG: F0F1 ATP synthase subunit B [Opitutaceae bacterium]|nr:F0F1 ATP synthase subunit B [Opitutaceae bacterium]
MLFVAAVEAAGQAHNASSDITKIAQDFGIDLPLILAQAVNFSVVAALLWYFAFKPVMATIEERKAKIAAGLKFADDAKAQLASAQQENAAMLKQTQAEAARIIDEARKTAKEFAERETAAATERANGIITKAQQAIDLEHRKMLEQARGEIARLVIATTQRVLAKELTDAERGRYNDAAARELSSVQ